MISNRELEDDLIVFEYYIPPLNSIYNHQTTIGPGKSSNALQLFQL